MTQFLSYIRFFDLVDRETQELQRLNHIKRQLENKQKDALTGRTITLSTADEKTLADVTAILTEVEKSAANKNKALEVCDPLFVTTRTLLNLSGGISPKLRSHQDGTLLFGGSKSREMLVEFVTKLREEVAPDLSTAGDDGQIGEVALAALTMGLIALDGVTAPQVEVVAQAGGVTGSAASENSDENAKKFGRTIYPDTTDPLFPAFTKAFFAALGEARSYGPMADSVLAVLAKEGDPDGFGGIRAQVSSVEYARVMRNLSDSNTPSNYAQLNRKVNDALNKVQGVGYDDIGDLSLSLPNFITEADNNLVSANVEVMGKHIVATMFDELKVFQVLDVIVHQFQQGTLPIGPGNAGKMLYKYWREAPNRMSEQERRNFAAITLGVPGGEPGAMVNRDFNDLWIRFVSSVSNLVRQNEVDSLLRARIPVPINQQQVRKSARDLANNLTLHGYGMAHFAGRELTQQINVMTKILGDPEIKAAFGARDMWQVVDQVATYDLGGAKTSSRYRTLASCGLIITAWLSRNIERIVQPTGPLINMAAVAVPDSGTHNATTEPNDYDLVNACELWLADTATSDVQVEQLSQPREAPQMTSKPIQIPAMAKEMLDGIGDIGMSLGVRTPSFH